MIQVFADPFPTDAGSVGNISLVPALGLAQTDFQSNSQRPESFLKRDAAET